MCDRRPPPPADPCHLLCMPQYFGKDAIAVYTARNTLSCIPPGSGSEPTYGCKALAMSSMMRFQVNMLRYGSIFHASWQQLQMRTSITAPDGELLLTSHCLRLVLCVVGWHLLRMRAVQSVQASLLVEGYGLAPALHATAQRTVRQALCVLSSIRTAWEHVREQTQRCRRLDPSWHIPSKGCGS